ncbi:Uncharacterized protein TCM_021345 [Theobroma cacao]|uniref:Uncharacterized protein n=1 Tax=Theobroma cacao TaxID=3641 RepID=A0A061EPZ2_THECC|nr:Uncharacterized protein TCM_021345 [Theobroma cacao]
MTVTHTWSNGLSACMVRRLAEVPARVACGSVRRMFMCDQVVNPSSNSLDSTFGGRQGIHHATISYAVQHIEPMFY